MAEAQPALLVSPDDTAILDMNCSSPSLKRGEDPEALKKPNAKDRNEVLKNFVQVVLPLTYSMLLQELYCKPSYT